MTNNANKLLITEGTKTITIKTSVHQLRLMQHFDQVWFGTPNSYKLYVAVHPSWRGDIIVASPTDVIERQGWDYIEESCDDCLADQMICVLCSDPTVFTTQVEISEPGR